MPTCVIKDSNDYIQAVTDSLNDCTGWVLFDPSEYASIVQPIDYALMGITPEAILYVYTWGMGAVLMIWGLGYAIGAAKKAIKQT